MYPALWMAVATSLGIAAADWVRPHPMVALGVFVLTVLWGIRVRSRPKIVAAILLALAGFGLLRYAYVQTVGRGSLGAWEAEWADIVGTVITEPELQRTDTVRFILAVETADELPATGRLAVTQWGGEPPGFGERVRLRGEPRPPDGPRRPGGYDEAGYLAKQGVYLTLDVSSAERLGPGRLGVLQRAAVATRLRLEQVLKATLPPEQAALMAGLLFGSRSELPQPIKEAFKASGVLHLLAVSGGNVAMIILPLLALLGWAGFPKRLAAALAIGVVLFFVFLTGAGPSVLRAGLMAVLVLLGDLLGRERNAINTLGAACFLLLLWQPGILFDLGFQLSVAATLGILLFARPIQRWLSVRFQPIFGEKPGEWLAAGLSVTLAAQVLVEPISLHAFGAVSTVAPVANLLVLAFLEPVVQAGSVAVLIGLISLPVAWLLNWLVRGGLFGLLFVVKAAAAMPGAYLQVGVLPLPAMLLWYGTLFLLTSRPVRQKLIQYRSIAQRWWRGARLRHKVAAIACTIFMVLTGSIWQMALAGSPDTLQVTFLDVGQGDAILIQAPGGGAMLVDAGPALPPNPEKGWTGYDMGAEVVAPFLEAKGIDRLDYLVLTHGDGDHSGGGVAVLKAVPVGTLLLGGLDGGESQRLREYADAGEVTITRPTAGDTVRLGSEVVAQVLNPPAEPLVGTRSDENSNCLALRLSYRQFSLLLACDLEPVAEERLIAEGMLVRADVLKLSHHGAAQSSTAPFLAAVRPTWAVIQVGAGNAYGHPSAKTLERLAQAGIGVYRTDQHGTVTLKTDGFTVRLSGARGGPLDGAYRPLAILGRRWFFTW